MATLNLTSAHIGTAAQHNGVFANLAVRYAKWKLYRETLRELDQLSARELADLGLHRSQIRAIAIEAAYGTK